MYILNINSITNGCGWETPDDTLILIGNCGISGWRFKDYFMGVAEEFIPFIRIMAPLNSVGSRNYFSGVTIVRALSRVTFERITSNGNR